MKNRIENAITQFGPKIVEDVQNMVELFDADGMYTTFSDKGMYEHAECVSFIYFEE